MAKKDELGKDDVSDIKAKYSEKKPLSFKDYAAKIKAKYTKPEIPTDDEKISQIKDKHRQSEQEKVDAPAKINMATAKNEKA